MKTDHGFLTVIPVYNEADSVLSVLHEVQHQSSRVLVVDDGSTDDTPRRLESLPHHCLASPEWSPSQLPTRSSKSDDHPVTVIRHPVNRGYGAALRSAFCFAIRHRYQWVITIDCDGQHEPQRIPYFVDATRDNRIDIISGSRYLAAFSDDATAPADRQAINAIITQELNTRFGLGLTDAFCGFKAYRVAALKRMTLTENGYAMPLQLWVQAALLNLRIQELPVPRIYLDPRRSFGEGLDDAQTRLAYYRSVMNQSYRDLTTQSQLPELSLARCGEVVDPF